MDLLELCKKHGIDPDSIGDFGEISDGYHTYNSLYEQRVTLFAALCNAFRSLFWKSKKHSDGDECFGGGWFIVGVSTPKGNYTYHYELKYWDMFDCNVLEKAPEHDGHTDKDVGRLLSLKVEPLPISSNLKNSKPEMTSKKSFR